MRPDGSLLRLLTFFLVLTVLGTTDIKAPVGFAGIAIGLVPTLIHLVGIPITNTSVNPARSIGPALFVGGWALGELWLFVVAPFTRSDNRGVCLLRPTWTRDSAVDRSRCQRAG